MSGFTLKLPGRQMEVLSVDGGNEVKAPEHTSSTLGVLHPGERIDVAVDWMTVAGLDATQDFLQVILDQEYGPQVRPKFIP